MKRLIFFILFFKKMLDFESAEFPITTFFSLEIYNFLTM